MATEDLTSHLSETEILLTIRQRVLSLPDIPISIPLEIPKDQLIGIFFLYN